MNNNNKIGQAEIDRFLQKVVKKLPVWLREDEKEKDDIIEEMEEHIWDKEEELSGTGTATDNSVRMAIAQMGTPKEAGKNLAKFIMGV